MAHLERHPAPRWWPRTHSPATRRMRPPAIVHAATRASVPERLRRAARPQRGPQPQLRARCGARRSRPRAGSASSRSARTGTPGSRSRSATRSGSSTRPLALVRRHSDSIIAAAGVPHRRPARDRGPHLRRLPARLEAAAHAARRGTRRAFLHAGLSSAIQGDRRVAGATPSRRSRSTRSRSTRRKIALLARVFVSESLVARSAAPSGRRAPAREHTGQAVVKPMRDLGRPRVQQLPVGGRRRCGRQALVFVATLVLARLLVPSEFGLVAFALAVIYFLEYVGRPRASARRWSTAPTPRTLASPPPPSGSGSSAPSCSSRPRGSRPRCWPTSVPDDEVVPLFRVLALQFPLRRAGQGTRVPAAAHAAVPHPVRPHARRAD